MERLAIDVFEVGDDGASEDRCRLGSKSRRSCATRAIAVILNRGEHRSSPERIRAHAGEEFVR
jgi:hypothetical protein